MVPWDIEEEKFSSLYSRAAGLQERFSKELRPKMNLEGRGGVLQASKEQPSKIEETRLCRCKNYWM